MADPDYTYKKPRKSNFSSDEIDALIATIKKHYGVLYGPNHKRGANKLARHRCWLDILRHVNQVSIEKRTLQEVKNKWKKCQYYYKSKDREYFAKFDSMPLEQRMASPAESGSQGSLKSQPLSPTKLKVTRQVAKSQYNSQKQGNSSQKQQKAPEPEEVCLRWNSHHSNMQAAFPSLLRREQYVDVTLVAEGKTIKCHRLILSSCSPYFEEVLNGISPFQHPIFFMKDVPYWILKSLCDFMYAGEVHIYQNKLQDLLAVAEALRIKGLAGKCAENTSQPEVQPQFKDVRSNFTATSRKNDVDEEVDPLDLLEPVYEEISKPSTSSGKTGKEAKIVPVKKVLPRKIKKRKMSEENEDSNLFQSPALIFPPRKGTRSRPNVKIPKYYHSIYDTPAQSKSASIEREPHRTLDPLIGVDDIKAEPFDPDDELIEIENNVVFADQEDPIEENVVAAKISVAPHPVLLEKAGASGAKMQIINLGKSSGGNVKIFDGKGDPLDTGLEIIDTANNKVVDPLILHSGDDDQLIISNIRSVAEESMDKENSSEEITGNDNVIHLAPNEDSSEKLENSSEKIDENAEKIDENVENFDENIEQNKKLDENIEQLDKNPENNSDIIDEPPNIEENEAPSENPDLDPISDTPEEMMEISETTLEDPAGNVEEAVEINENIQKSPPITEINEMETNQEEQEEEMEISEAQLENPQENIPSNANPENSEEPLEIQKSPLAEPDLNKELNPESTNHDPNPSSNEIADNIDNIPDSAELENKDSNEMEQDLDAITEKALLECNETNENDQDQEADLQNLLQSLDDQ